ncbi:MAG: CYTH domain-containing protein [Acidobacteria bacterium]|nr:CYTH domain-containing protein [Acidobacteriota bacterium]
MGREIERKFLVKDTSWENEAPGIPCIQGYLSLDPDRVVRVRIMGKDARITIKSRISNRIRREFEYPIPLEDAEEMLEKLALGSLIDKTRHFIDFKGHTWEIDRFEGENSGLIIAEVELAGVDEEVELPPWIGMEVTDDPRYLNISLCQTPYSSWNVKTTI